MFCYYKTLHHVLHITYTTSNCVTQVMCVTHNTGHIMTFIITRILLVHYIVGYHIIHIHSVQRCHV